nr:4Fe-4S dicluster domain-containing protein [Sulfurospirillum tamanensis]
MKNLRNRAGIFNYPNLIRYDSTLCDTSTCQKCQEICPVKAISVNTLLDEVTIAQLECTSCGECLHGCPTRALDYIPFTQAMLQKTVQKCAHKRLVVIPAWALESLRGIALPEGIVPVVVQGCGGFSDWHWLVMLQNLGVNVVVYDSKLPESTKKAIYCVNELYRRIYDKKAILWAKSPQEFEEALSKEQALVKMSFEETKEPQEDFDRRLSALVQALHVKNEKGVNE